MRNIALKLMYNGTAYHGWQVQKNAVTVCETLQKALEKITGAPVHLTGCGRTDAGVHAERYIANFRTESRIPLERLPFAINTHTPEDTVELHLLCRDSFGLSYDFTVCTYEIDQDGTMAEEIWPVTDYNVRVFWEK